MGKFNKRGTGDAAQGFKVQRIAPIEYTPDAGEFVLIGLDIPSGGPLDMKWCASVNDKLSWDGASIVRVDGMRADFYTDTPEEMKRILAARGYPKKRMFVIEK